MNKTYRNIIAGILITGLLLGGLAFVLQYGVFQGIRASKEERSNKECQTEERVFDEAKVLTEKEEAQLEEIIREKEKIVGADIVLLTIRDREIDNDYKMRDYAQKYYEENKFGWDKPNGDGIIYVDNWATGYCWMCTTGKAAEKLDDGAVSYIINRTNERVNEDPYKAYRTMVKVAAEEMQNLNLFHFHISSLWILLAALAASAIFAACNLMGNKGKITTDQYTYVPEGGVKINRKEDIFLHSHVTRRKIEQEAGGGSGGSIGGTDGHGGGGGRH